jgi:hypothetical protein
MSTAWPATLPLCGRRQDYQPLAATIRTEREYGHAIVRRRFTTVPVRCRATWIMTTDQLAIFEAWYDYYLSAGAAWATGVTLQTSAGIESTHSARFLEASFPRAKRAGKYWEISLTLEISKPTQLSKDDLDALLTDDLDLGEMVDLINPAADQLHTTVHTDFPASLVT